MGNLNSSKLASALRKQAQCEVRARRLKMVAVSAACVLGVALGVASAAMSQMWFTSDQGPGRRVSFHELQWILEHQAEASLRGETPVFPHPEDTDL